jgi:hypothetical protein
MAEAFGERRICAFTADGPRGPARVVKPGPVQLAELTGAAWVGCFHAEAERAWRLRSWDGFVVPKPFSRVTVAWPENVRPELGAVQQAMERAEAMAHSATAQSPMAHSPTAGEESRD